MTRYTVLVSEFILHSWRSCLIFINAESWILHLRCPHSFLKSIILQKNQYCMKYPFNIKVSYCVLNFKGALLNVTRNILPVHWNNYLLFRSECEELVCLRAEIFGGYETASRSFEQRRYINKFLDTLFTWSKKMRRNSTQFSFWSITRYVYVTSTSGI